MKKALILGLVFVGASAAYSPATAGSLTIYDTYYGANITSEGVVVPDDDVIGEDEYYDLDHMDVVISETDVMVKIWGQYFDNIGKDNTKLGDLFISTDDWSPSGTAAYYYDTDVPGNGEDWEFALVLNNRDSNIIDATTGESIRKGSASLYAVNESKITYAGPSLDITNGFRWGQEVLYDGTGGTSSGGWEIFGLKTPDDYSDDYLQLTFANTFGLDIKNFALSWTMTCANDIIEGGTPVPEPATLLLFGSGLAGLAGSALRRRKKL